jgi:hypothetical protein
MAPGGLELEVARGVSPSLLVCIVTRARESVKNLRKVREIL